MLPRRVAGILLLLTSGLMVTITGALSKYLERLPSGEIITIFGLLLIPVVILPALTFEPFRFPTKRDTIWLSLRGLTAALSYVSYLFAAKNMKFGDATALLAINPIFAAIFGRIFLKEQFGLVRLLCTIFGLAGVILISRPQFIFQGTKFANETSILPSLAAIFSAVMTGGTAVLQRLLSEHQVSPWMCTLIIVSGNFFVGLPFDVATNQELALPSCYSERTILLLASFASVASAVLFNEGLKYEDATVASLLRNIEIVSAYVFQIVFFGESLNWLSIGGSVIVFISTFCIICSSIIGNTNISPLQMLHNCGDVSQSREDESEDGAIKNMAALQ